MQPHHHRHTINNHLHKLSASISISIISGLMITSSTAEPPPPSPPPPPELAYSYPTITIILTIVVLIFLFVGFLSMYFCRCIMHNVVYAWYFTAHTTAGPNSGTGPPNSSANHPGIDPAKIQSFPTFTYSSVKNFRKSKSCELECAICLVEFEDSTVLRLITVCCHVFHQECIDLWLESHKTCPVCRMDLNSATCDDNRSGPLKDSVYRNRVMERINENEPIEDVSILIDNDDRMGGDESKNNVNDGEMNRTKMERDCEVRIRVCDEDSADCVVEKFSRSHSTGHSIVKVNRELVLEGEGDEDRFTLRLPENVKEKIMIRSLRHHSTSRSCTTFGEYCRDRACKIRNVELGEVSGEKNKG